MGLGDFATAAKLRDVVEEFTGKYLERVRPSYRYGVVLTVTPAVRSCTVKFPEDGIGESMTVRYAFFVPYPGAVVRVDGRSGDRFVSEVMGTSAGMTPIGGIIDYTCAEAFAPYGFVPLDGRAISRTTYAEYFAMVGTTYGVGNGTTTFNIPNAKGRVIAGLDNMGGVDGGIVSTANTLGTTTGSETFAQAASDVAAHAHSVSITTGTVSADHSHSISMLTGHSGSPANPGNTLNGGGNPPPVFAAMSGAGYTFWNPPNTGGISANHTHAVNGNTGNNSQTTSMNRMQPTIFFNKLLRIL